MGERVPVRRGLLDALAGAAGRRAYLAGVGGAGMRGLATFLLADGWEVCGADRQGLAADDPLLGAGLRLLSEEEAPPPVSLAVRSAAVPGTAPGFAAALRRGARGLRYAELLGEITRLRPALAVAGSHGKTTTTAWIAWGLREAGQSVGWLVGGRVPQLGASAAWGDPGEILVVESCEFDRGFHCLHPAQAALTNVDEEHPDTYPGGLPEVEEAFARFLEGVPAGGRIFAGPQAPGRLPGRFAAPWIRVPPLAAGVEVGLPGRHNRANAALVAAVLEACGVGRETILRVLREFRGAARRLERVGTLGGALVVSDYAHHPVEVAATLDGAREAWPGKRLVVVFQPHQATRFARFREAFAEALREVDALVLFEVYRARDPEELRVRSAELLPLLPGRLREAGRLCQPASPGEAACWLRERCGPGDLILCLGAGDIDGFARRLVD